MCVFVISLVLALARVLSESYLLALMNIMIDTLHAVVVALG